MKYLQCWYDDKMPGVAASVIENNQLVVEMSDLNLCADGLDVIPVRGHFQLLKFDKLKPAMQTAAPNNRRKLLLAKNER